MNSSEFFANPNNIIVSDSLRDSLPDEFLAHVVKDTSVKCTITLSNKTEISAKLMSFARSTDGWSLDVQAGLDTALQPIVDNSTKLSQVEIFYDENTITTYKIKRGQKATISGDVSGDLIYIKMKVTSPSRSNN
jgi:hypothetical protein